MIDVSISCKTTPNKNATVLQSFTYNLGKSLSLQNWHSEDRIPQAYQDLGLEYPLGNVFARM
jgi:hypothetical protein